MLPREGPGVRSLWTSESPTGNRGVRLLIFSHTVYLLLIVCAIGLVIASLWLSVSAARYDCHTQR